MAEAEPKKVVEEEEEEGEEEESNAEKQGHQNPAATGVKLGKKVQCCASHPRVQYISSNGMSVSDLATDL